MARRSVLEDVSKQNRVIRAILDGRSDYEAAREVGTTYQSLWRYCNKNEDFRRRLERAKDKAAARAGVAEGVAVAAEVLRDPTPPSQIDNPPSKDAVLAASVMGVDSDLVNDVDEILSDDLIELSTQVNLSRPTVHGYMMVCWKRFLSGRSDAPVYGKLMEKILTGPTLRAQARRDAIAARREALALEAEMAKLTAQPEGGGAKRPRNSGLTVLEVPHNPARPWVNRGAEDVEDAEVEDAEVVE